MLTQRALFDGFWHPSFAKKLHASAKKLWQLKAAGKKRSCGFFPPSLPNALIQTPPSLKAFVNTMALDKKAMAVAQSYGGRGILAKELSMTVRI